jgi:hypothetical protein
MVVSTKGLGPKKEDEESPLLEAVTRQQLLETSQARGDVVCSDF